MTLKQFGFKENCISWIKILYTDIRSSVIVNNFISSPFNINRGVRQGCALSALLYILVLEPFVNQVRLDANIKGLGVPGSEEEAKISCYADDSTSILTNTHSVSLVLNKCKLFGRASGAKLNISKTKGMFLGKWKNRSDHPFGISWVKSTKLLGSKLGYFLTNDDIWGNTFTKFQSTLDLFKYRKLTYKGKSYVINSLATSKLWYLTSFNLIPQHYLTLTQRTVFKYFWNTNSEHLKRDILYKHYLKGGQNIVNISLKSKAFLLKHVQHLLNNCKAKWTYFAIYWIGLPLRKYNAQFGSLKIPHSEYIPPFYKVCLETFQHFRHLMAEQNKLNIENLSVKEFYKHLSSSNNTFPRVVSKNPKVDYNHIWRELQRKLIDPFSRDLSWRIAHEIVPVQHVLYQRKITSNLKCPFCSEVESITHLFHMCILVRPLYDLVFARISMCFGHTVLPNNDIIFNFTYPSSDEYEHNIIAILLSEVKYTIWVLRNRTKFENAKVTSQSIISYFFNRLRLRIHADFKRLHIPVFINLWAFTCFCCVQFDNGKTTL